MHVIKLEIYKVQQRYKRGKKFGPGMAFASTLATILRYVEQSKLLSLVLFTPRVSNPAVLSLCTPGSGRICDGFLTRVVLGTFRGMSQVSFANNALGGLLILIGCFLSDARIASTFKPVYLQALFHLVLGLTGALVPTVLAYIIAAERSAATNGLHAYNGFLIGLGTGYFNAILTLDDSDWITFTKLLIPTIFLAAMTFYLHIGIRSLCPSIPPFTLAYNLVLSCWLVWTVSLGESSAFFPFFASPDIAPLDATPIEFDNISFEWFVKATMAGVGQVYFMPGLTSSILILVGLVLGSPLIGVMAVLGSAIGLLLTVVAHGPIGPAAIGLSGYNGVLVSIGIGCFYYVISWASLSMAVVGTLLSVLARTMFSSLLVHPVGPALTLPFCFVGAFLYAAGPSVGAQQVPNHTLDFPEAHLVKTTAGLPIPVDERKTPPHLDQSLSTQVSPSP